MNAPETSKRTIEARYVVAGDHVWSAPLVSDRHRSRGLWLRVLHVDHVSGGLVRIRTTDYTTYRHAGEGIAVVSAPHGPADPRVPLELQRLGVIDVFDDQG